MQHVHNLLGSKRAVYHPQHAQDAQGSTAAEPEIVAEFGLSANKPNPRTNGSAHRSNSNNSSNSRGISSRQSSRQAPQSTGAPFVSVGFQTLPGFAPSSSSSSSGSVNQGPTAAAASSSSPSLFSGGGAPLKGIQNARPPCELCGGTDYRSRAPVTDRCDLVTILSFVYCSLSWLTWFMLFYFPPLRHISTFLFTTLSQCTIRILSFFLPFRHH